MAAIVTEGLTKYYGKTPGIIDLDIEVNVGEVFGPPHVGKRHDSRHGHSPRFRRHSPTYRVHPR
jgi:hypothetical protein